MQKGEIRFGVADTVLTLVMYRRPRTYLSLGSTSAQNRFCGPLKPEKPCRFFIILRAAG